MFRQAVHLVMALSLGLSPLPMAMGAATWGNGCPMIGAATSEVEHVSACEYCPLPASSTPTDEQDTPAPAGPDDMTCCCVAGLFLDLSHGSILLLTPARAGEPLLDRTFASPRSSPPSPPPRAPAPA